MTNEELIRALRDYNATLTALYGEGVKDGLFLAAADRLEELTANTGGGREMNVSETIKELRNGAIDESPTCCALIDKAADALVSLAAELTNLQQTCNQLQRERDAAVHDLNNGITCFSCKHFRRNGGACSGWRQCVEIAAKNGFVPVPFYEWRGLCEDNGGGGHG